MRLAVVACGPAFALLVCAGACSAPSAGDVDLGVGDAGAADAGDGLTDDAGDGLTDDERDFFEALLHASCAGSICIPDNVPEFHDDVDACARIWRPMVLGTLPAALKSGVISFDPTMADACIEFTAACPPLYGIAPNPCDQVLRREHPQPVGGPCTIPAECSADDACNNEVVLSLPCPRPSRCVHTLPLGSMCTNIIDDSICASSPGRDIQCNGGRCRAYRHVVSAIGDPCDIDLPPDPDGTFVTATCGAGLFCSYAGDVHECVARPREGEPCEGTGVCETGLVCESHVCTRRTFIGPGERGCATSTARHAARLCDVTQRAFCDYDTDTCILAGDGAAGSTCDQAGYYFPCASPLVCVYGICAERPALGTPCRSYADGCECDTGVCAACA